MNDKTELVTQESAVTMFGTTDPAAIAAAETAKTRISMAYMKAMHDPRNPEQSRVKILDACKRPQFAERVEFRKPVGGGKVVAGPTIRFAETCIREWGNILTETQAIYEDDKIRRTKITCIDLESNNTYTKEITVSKTVERSYCQNREVVAQRVNSQGKPVYIVVATEEELDTKECGRISRAVRNEGLRLIPSDIVDEGLIVAKRTIQDRDAKDPKAAMRNISDNFREIGVYPKDLDKYLGQTLESASPAQMQELRSLYRSIRDGETTWADIIGSNVDDAQAGTESQTEKLRKKAEDLKAKRKAQPDDSPAQAVEQDQATPPSGGSDSAAEPDDWERLDGDDLVASVTNLINGDYDYTRALEKLTATKDWTAVRNLARTIATTK